MRVLPCNLLVLTPVAVVGLAAMFSDSASAQALISSPQPLVSEHVDLNLGYSGGAWTLGPRDSDNIIQYAGQQVILHVDNASQVTQPASGFEFTGAAPGQPLYVLPQPQTSPLLYLGFSAYGVPANTFDSYNASAESGGRVSGTAEWLKVNLASVKGPGHFSLWSQSGTSPTTVQMSTASGGITTDDALWIPVDGHIHYNFGFTERGLYQVNLIPSGLRNGVRESASQSVPIYLNVDPGYTTSGVTSDSTLASVGSITASATGFSETTLSNAPVTGSIALTNIDPADPIYVLLALADASEVGALTVALNGSTGYELAAGAAGAEGRPYAPNLLSQYYGLADIPATATIDNSVLTPEFLAEHPGFDLALRFEAIPGSTFDFEFDYSMVLDGVGIDRVGVIATAVPEPASLALALVAAAAGLALVRCRRTSNH